MKKDSIKYVLIAVWIVIFVKFAVVLVENKAEEKPELVVKLNLDGDFPNPEEGSAVFNMRLLMDNIIKVHKRVPKYVIFTESKVIPGLVLRYNVHDSVFEGGLPLLKSKDVVFLDGGKHEVVYTFKKGAEQKFYFDGEEVASGIFDPSKIGITGFAVSGLVAYRVETISFDGSVEFR